MSVNAFPAASAFARPSSDRPASPGVSAAPRPAPRASTSRALPARLALLLLVAPLATIALAALPAPDADNGGIELPPGFRATVVADNLVAGRKVGNNNDALRFIAVAPNGDLYAKTSRGGIFALRDTDGDGRFDQQSEFGAGGGTGIALRDGWLYHSTNSAVYRYRHAPGDLVPSDAPQLIVGGLPDEHHTHDAKSFAFDTDGRLLVEVGSPYNVFSEPDRQRGAKGKDATEFLKTHGGFWLFDPDKPNQTLADGVHFSTGHRHSLAVAWNAASKNFFMTMMGRDNLNTVAPEHYDELDNAERVSEEMHLLREGANLGWPYTYWDPIKKARMVAPEFGGDNRQRAEPGKYSEPVVAFPAHWAPLQMAFYGGTQFPPKYRGGAFIAFHGSWNRAPRPQEGYNISFVPFDQNGLPVGGYEVFARGFPGKSTFTNTRDARYRPGGVAVGPDGSLYVSDTDKGRIWRIVYTGETPAATPATPPSTAHSPITPPAPPPVSTPAPAASTPPPANATPSLNTRGKTIYDQFCAACHMPDGTGVSNLQPPLLASSVVAGDPTQLIRVLLRGPAAVLPADRARYGNVMPPFPTLTDQQAADVLNYLRQTLNTGPSSTPAISSGAVAAERARL